jgi:hypothetical protein
VNGTKYFFIPDRDGSSAALFKDIQDEEIPQRFWNPQTVGNGLRPFPECNLLCPLNNPSTYQQKGFYLAGHIKESISGWKKSKT